MIDNEMLEKNEEMPTPEPGAMYKEGLQRILESNNIEEIKSIAQELLGMDSKMANKSQVRVEVSQKPSLRDKLAATMNEAKGV